MTRKISAMLCFVQGITGSNPNKNKNNPKPEKLKKTRSTSSVGLSVRSAPATPMSPLQGHSDTHLSAQSGQSSANINAISRSPSHSSNKSDSKSAKQLSTSPPNNRSISPKSSKQDEKEKEKEREKEKEKETKEKKQKKELSASRQKKFHRHFQQVAEEEKVLNYYSCALVSDILLQGHLYITNHHFAFYSNVFGYVTKLLIPTVSVVKVSKEKTGKIFPNAIGVATADERHVFGSFMSRESAYRLMLSVWRPIESPEVEPEIIPKLPDVEISSIEDDSSCSASGNESPPRLQEKSSNENSPTMMCGGASTISLAASDESAKHLDGSDRSPLRAHVPSKYAQFTGHEAVNATTLPPNVSPSPSNLFTFNPVKFKFPTDVHVVYLGVILAVILSLFSGFLLYKIQDIQARTSGMSSLDFKLGAAKDLDVYAEVLRWQKDMQSKSSEEAQIILTSNLEHIARVRKSLETLSLLIHDNNSPYVQSSSAPLVTPASSTFGSSDGGGGGGERGHDGGT